MNAFKHGLAAIQKRVNTEHEESVRQQILNGLIADKGGDAQISTATRILAEVIASDAAWLVVFNGAIDHVIQNNPKARQNPRGLSQLDGYKRGLDAAPRPAAQVVTRLHPSVTSAGTISALNPIIRPILRVARSCPKVPNYFGVVIGEPQSKATNDPSAVVALRTDTNSTGRSFQGMAQSAVDNIPPGPKLDALTAEKVFGWKNVHQHHDRGAL
jgi:hypothetical protein